MSVLVVGLSHKTAPVPTLERAVVTGDTLGKLLRDVFSADGVAGSLVVSTCNRVEVYAEAGRFHPAVADITAVLAERAGVLRETDGEVRVGELVRRLGMSQPLVSKHLRVLKDAGLVQVRAEQPVGRLVV